MIRKVVFERFKAFLGSQGAGAKAGGQRRTIEAYQLAAAALMVEAARMDDSFDAGERAKIQELLIGRFGLSPAEGEALLASAEAEVAESSQLYGFTKTIKDAFSAEERIEVVEMLWEVAYSDGELHDFEASLIRRVTGLLHVSDRDSGAARKRALDRLAS